MPQPLVKNQYPGAPAGPRGPQGPQGPDISGDPNAIVFVQPDGTGSATDPKLTATPIDQYGRPQVRDLRQDNGTGPIFRQGAWQVDGDAENIAAEGYVCYKPRTGQPRDGEFARVKGNRIGIRRIWGAVDLDYAVMISTNYTDGTDNPPSTWDGIYLRNDARVRTFVVDRPTGNMTLAAGSKVINGSGNPEGAVAAPPGSMFLNANGNTGSEYALYIKESGTGNTGWYGIGSPPV